MNSHKQTAYGNYKVTLSNNISPWLVRLNILVLTASRKDVCGIHSEVDFPYYVSAQNKFHKTVQSSLTQKSFLQLRSWMKKGGAPKI